MVIVFMLTKDSQGDRRSLFSGVNVFSFNLANPAEQGRRACASERAHPPASSFEAPAK